MPNLSKHRQSPALVALGQAIRDIRLERDMSQESLALLAEVDRSYLGRVERGDNNVAVLSLLKIAEALDITVRDLIARAGL
ncbi:helix-turn-helix domain-containing protein [Pseudoduganella violaceinigra]|uniref:helix-turn-helix domain-containing protein n=1 Tax=Pseudoduganella violaceinigra TaxID=246602 RepID=UPI000484977E|nr:helix-turn-helix transcriptional regulator [Pseudoduganella violaceinigra]